MRYRGALVSTAQWTHKRTLAFGHHEERTPTHGYARGSNGGVREELAAGQSGK